MFSALTANILLFFLHQCSIWSTNQLLYNDMKTWGLIYKMLRRNHPKFDLTIISKICVRAIHRMNVQTEIARTPLFQM